MSTVYEDRKTDIEHGNVKKSIDTIRDCSKTMSGIFEDFRNTMNTVYQDDNFQGNASESLQGKFAELRSKFDSYVDAVERFAKAVEIARESAEATENAIQREAEDLIA